MDDCCSDGSSGLGDPLARLSDLGSCSSWSTSPAGSPTPEDEQVDWQQRCLGLQLEFQKYKLQASKARDALKEKLNELEQRVIDAEARAEEAEDKVRIMEQRLVEAEWSGTGTSGPTESEEKEREEAISKLASQVEQQRQLRLADARQVEAKAARIKEWVTNKLKELEAQNQHLREQNHRCNQQLELLRRHMGDIGTDRVRPQSLLRSNTTASTTALLENEAVYAEVPRRPKPVPQEPGTTSLGHRRHLSATAVAINTSPSQQLSDDLQAAVESLALLPVHIRPKSECMDSEQGHDYAEIYTPSTEKDAWDVGKPPTPPLHRFPSWESRIYQVASEGLAPHPTPDSSNNNTATRLHASQGYCDISVPVYATVKGRASQIRSMPFTGDSSDDSSDGEGEHTNAMNLSTTRGTNSSSDNTDTSLSSSSPSKSHIQTTSSFSPAKRSSSGSPSKSMLHAVSCESLDWSGLARGPGGSPSRAPRGAEQIEKTGHLAKLGGKLKTWTRRWFQLNNAKLRYWKSQNDVNRKPQGEISIDEHCRINRAEGAATFEIATEKKTYYLTADSIAATEDWVRVLQNVQRRNATKLLLSKEHNKPTLQGWLTKVRNGHAKKCWCVLLGKMFLYFKSPSDTNAVGQINMRDARVQQVEHVSDSDSEDRDSDLAQLTIGIFPNHQPPTYLLMPSKQENDSWLYHLTVVSGAGPNAGTQYEQLVQKLMETDGDPNCVLWRHPLLLHSKETIASPLTTLSSEQLQADAIKLFKSCQLFTSVAVESAGIDYHVVLAQNALQQCLDQWELQAEMMCALVKQTSRHQPSKTGVQVFAKLRHRSLFSCDGAGSPTVGPLPTPPPQAPVDSVKANPPNFALVQAWQLLALAVSLFVPKNNKLLWYLKLHLLRNTDSKTECGKYAAYCERALERTITNGGRDAKPSRMEVLSILLKNPYHHSLPHSIPVHFLNGTYQVVGFDGSTTIEEFMTTLNTEISCRESSCSGFTLFSDDPIEKDLEHYIDPQAKLCDVISKWETALREKGSGKFETTRVIQLTYKNRLYWRHSAKMETDRERLLLCYQTNLQVVQGRFPVNRDLALELAALMAQIDFGEDHAEKARGSGGNVRDLQVLQALDKFYPYRYRDGLASDTLKDLQSALQEKWMSLKGRGPLDCVRIYLTCSRKWPYFGASLFQAKLKQSEWGMVWVAVAEDCITLLELGTMQPLARYPYASVLTFGGCQDDFMLVVNSDEGLGSQKLLFALSKPKILELTLLIADYMNALGEELGLP
uniref:Pleckstrin y domain-containing family H member 1 n=4 Tax=Lygus hesperus TaxID=30085 RepID=A0A0K8SBX6_LYGHE